MDLVMDLVMDLIIDLIIDLLVQQEGEGPEKEEEGTGALLLGPFLAAASAAET